MGVDVHGAVVVIDEAHNLMDAIEQLHSFTLTRDNLLESLNLLQRYLSKYKSRLSGDSQVSLKKLVLVVTKLLKRFGEH